MIRFFRRLLIFSVVAPVLLLVGPMYLLATEDLTSQRWMTANRDSAGLSPPAATTEEAVVQVLAARTFGWRGAFAVHSWIATKEKGATVYQVHHVLGWRSSNHVVSGVGVPDRHWYGAKPQLVSDIRGPEAEALIPQILDAIERYPYPNRYRAWPGPNSNTFVAFVAREVPNWGVSLPGLAIGKDFLGDFQPVAAAPSGSGFQVNLHGLLGFTAAVEEGVELNVLGMTVGVDPLDLAVSVPGFGRIGP